ncbi:hypothetical protein CKA32_000677 [Geitlerinema sp. FC II]|nr:hypothetical protein CKA32_000677 [Geitlerinema sp. FC II]
MRFEMARRWRIVSIPRRDFWVFQLEFEARCGRTVFQSLEGIFGFFNRPA